MNQRQLMAVDSKQLISTLHFSSVTSLDTFKLSIDNINLLDNETKVLFSIVNASGKVIFEERYDINLFKYNCSDTMGMHKCVLTNLESLFNKSNFDSIAIKRDDIFDEYNLRSSISQEDWQEAKQNQAKGFNLQLEYAVIGLVYIKSKDKVVCYYICC